MGMISSFYSNVYGYQKRKKKTKAQKAVSERRRMAYSKFLLTPYWQEVREAVRARDGGKCKLCGVVGPFDVHHVVYTNRGDELNHLHELATLCRECHLSVHRQH